MLRRRELHFENHFSQEMGIPEGRSWSLVLIQPGLGLTLSPLVSCQSYSNTLMCPSIPSFP